MILHEMKHISCAHLENIFMQKLSAEHGRRHVSGRLQQASVSKSRRAAIPVDTIRMNMKQFLNRQEDWIHNSLRQLLERATVIPMSFFQRFQEFLFARR